MGRKLAARINKMGAFGRLAVAQGYRLAARFAGFTTLQRATLRVAARYVLGGIDSPAYDMMLRLQVLDGVSGASPPGPQAGIWWKQGRRGLQAAKAYFKDQNELDIDPSWFSSGNTGMIKKFNAIIGQQVKSVSKGRDVPFSTEDFLQNTVMGLTKDGKGSLSGGPIFFQVGHFNPKVKRSVLSGKDTPADVAGVGGALVKKKVLDEIRGESSKSRARNVTEEGTSILDLTPASEKDLDVVLLDMLSDTRSPAFQLILKALISKVGKGKWAELATKIFVAEMTGQRIRKQDLAREFGMAGGTLSKVIRERIQPVLKDLRGDKHLQDKLMDMAEIRAMRMACQRVALRVARQL